MGSYISSHSTGLGWRSCRLVWPEQTEQTAVTDVREGSCRNTQAHCRHFSPLSTEEQLPYMVKVSQLWTAPLCVHTHTYINTKLVDPCIPFSNTNFLLFLVMQAAVEERNDCWAASKAKNTASFHCFSLGFSRSCSLYPFSVFFFFWPLFNCPFTLFVLFPPVVFLFEVFWGYRELPLVFLHWHSSSSKSYSTPNI